MAKENKPLPAHSERGKIGDRRLSRGQAFRIAVANGYQGCPSNLGRDIGAGSDNFGLAMVPIEERRRGTAAKNYIEVERVAW